MFLSISSPDSLLTWHHRVALAEILFLSPPPERGQRPVKNSRINGSQGADVRLIWCCCLPPPGLFTASHWWLCPVLPGPVHFLLFTFGFDASTEWNEGALFGG